MDAEFIRKVLLQVRDFFRRYAAPLRCLPTRGLRRGLHSFAATRLVLVALSVHFAFISLKADAGDAQANESESEQGFPMIEGRPAASSDHPQRQSA